MYNENRVGIASSNKLYTFKKNNLNKTRKSTQRMRCVTTSLALHDVQRVCTDDHGSVWKTGQKAFLDVRVFNPLAGRYGSSNISKAYTRSTKKRRKDHTMKGFNKLNREHLLYLFSATGGMGRECFCKRICELLAEK